MATNFSKYGTPTTKVTPIAGTDFSKYGVPTNKISITKAEEGAKGFKGFGVGALKGFGSTAVGAGQLLEKVLPGNLIATPEQFQKAKEYVAPKGTAEKFGFGAEQLAEFLIPSGAVTKGIKAVDIGAEALKGGKIATMLLKLGGRSAIEAGTAAGVSAIQSGGNTEDIARNALLAGVGGPAVEGLVRGGLKVVGALGARSARLATQEAEKMAILKSGVPEAEVATRKIVNGKIVVDKTATEAVRQGIPSADVALVKAGSATDKIKMGKMLDIRENQLTNKRVVDRATDVVGNTFIENAKFIESKNKEAAKQLDFVAQRLAGKKVDPGQAVTQFADDLDRSGIKVRVNGTLNFKGSDFEGLKSVQQSIVNVWNRAERIARTGDALQIHRTKSFIDNIVEYGAEGQGLSGKAERMLKSFRHNIDGILDTKFKAYNEANTIYSDTINELSKIGQAMGRKFRLSDTFANARAGVAMRRILSNTQSRSDILQLLDSMQKVGQKYGMKIDQDIVTQANFADLLEKMLGSEAPTSFLGQVERGLETFGSTTGIQGLQQGASAVSELMRGNIIRGGIKGVTAVGEKLLGINQANKIKALRALLKTEGEKVGSMSEIIPKVIKQKTNADILRNKYKELAK